MKLKIRIIVVFTAVLLSACLQAKSGETAEAPFVKPKPCPTYSVLEGQEIPQEQADLLIGMVEDDAEACAIDLGWQWRVGERDGEFYALTMDYRPDRVTVQIQEGIIYLVNVG